MLRRVVSAIWRLISGSYEVLKQGGPGAGPAVPPPVPAAATAPAGAGGDGRRMPHPVAAATPPAHVQAEANVPPAQAVKQGQGQFRQIALTFDTEFHPDITPQLLDVLDANQAKSTFFLVGKEVSPYNTLAHRIAATHEIGNHTYHHVDMTQLTPSEQETQLRMADMAIGAEAGRSPKPFFRPPFGLYNDTVLQSCGNQGYPYVLSWTEGLVDETNTVESEVNDLITKASPGAIALFHGWTVNTPPALERALPELRRKGYQFVTISEILGIGRGNRDWGGTPIHVQEGETLEFLGAAYNTQPAFLGAYNDLDGEPAAGTVLMTPHRDEVIVRVNGHRLDFDVYPRIIADRTIVPVRPVCEYVGSMVTWMPATRQVQVERKDKRIVFTIDSDKATVNGTAATLPVPAQIVGDRTMVPLRFLGETLGFAVAWDGATRTVSITTGK